MRVGVVGSGFGRRVVAPVFAATAGCEVVDVVSARDAEAVDALCRRPDVDLVSVHSPPFLHADHVGSAIDAGHAVLCDKPIGLDATEAAALHAQADAAGVPHLVNFEFRHAPMRRRLRELATDGSLGSPVHVTWTHVSSGSRVPLRPFGWLFRAELGGGWIRAWASHAVDTLRWMLDDVTVIDAQRRLDIPERPGSDGRLEPVDAEDGLLAWLRAGSGATITLDSTFAAPASLAPRIVVEGTDAVAECVADAKVVVRDVHGACREEKAGVDSAGDAHLAPMRRWAEVVRDVVTGDRAAAGPDVPTFFDAVACARVLDELRAAPLTVRS